MTAEVSADASAVKSAGFFQLIGRILLESFINIICLTILIFLKGYLIGLYPKKFIFTLIKLLCIDLSYISCSACLKLNTIIGLHTTTTTHHHHHHHPPPPTTTNFSPRRGRATVLKFCMGS